VTRIGASLGTVLLAACATTLQTEARRAAETGIDPAPLVAELQARYAEIEATKRIFSVTLIEGRRRFAGDGAIEYRADPKTLKADVFGPHDTPVVHVRLVGEMLTVRLPQEGEILTGKLGDPKFAALTGERALASPEVLGAVLGAYDVARLTRNAEWTAAFGEGERNTLYIAGAGTIHALTLEGNPSRLVEYRQERAGRLIYRVRFSDFQPVGERHTPRKVVLRDYIKERQLVFNVHKEERPSV
jgi:hypothetical protein